MPQMWPSYWELLTNLSLLIILAQISIHSKIMFKEKAHSIWMINKKK